jgi:putative ABC transport system ATP-binding protein
MVSIENLVFEYPGSTFSLLIDQLTIGDGERVAFVGPSGSGKTTLLNLLCGISRPASGRIQVAGHDLSTMGDAARRNFRIANIGLVFQQFELIPYLNVVDNVLLPYRINRALQLDAASREMANRLIGSVGLEDKLRRYPHQLSQGEQQRTALCRALVNRPRLVLADEPTGNLDHENKQRVLEILFEHTGSESQGLVVVTHDVNILEGFDRVVDFTGFRASREVAT